MIECTFSQETDPCPGSTLTNEPSCAILGISKHRHESRLTAAVAVVMPSAAPVDPYTILVTSCIRSSARPAAVAAGPHGPHRERLSILLRTRPPDAVPHSSPGPHAVSQALLHRYRRALAHASARHAQSGDVQPQDALTGKRYSFGGGIR